MHVTKKTTVREFIIGGGAIVGLSAGFITIEAEAQPTTVPGVTLTHANDAVQILPGSVPQATNVYATPAQIANTPGYVKEGNVAAGFALTFGNAQADMMLEPSAGITAGNITFAAAPSDGQRACVLSTQAVSATLNFIPNTGQTLNGNVTSLSGNVAVCWTYSAGNAVWDRSP